MLTKKPETITYYKVCSDGHLFASDNIAVLGFDILDGVIKDQLDTTFLHPSGHIFPPAIGISAVQRQRLPVDNRHSLVLKAVLRKCP